MQAEMCLSDRERFDEELQELRKENVELLPKNSVKSVVTNSSTEFVASFSYFDNATNTGYGIVTFILCVFLGADSVITGVISKTVPSSSAAFCLFAASL